MLRLDPDYIVEWGCASGREHQWITLQNVHLPTLELNWGQNQSRPGVLQSIEWLLFTSSGVGRCIYISKRDPDYFRCQMMDASTKTQGGCACRCLCHYFVDEATELHARVLRNLRQPVAHTQCRLHPLDLKGLDMSQVLGQERTRGSW